MRAGHHHAGAGRGRGDSGERQRGRLQHRRQATAIKKVADLNGKSLGTPGIGSIQDAMVDSLAKNNGIKIAHKAMKVSDMPIFLQKGEIDGFIAWAPHPARASN